MGTSGCKDGMVCLWDTSIRQPRQPRLTLPQQVVHGIEYLQEEIRVAPSSRRPLSPCLGSGSLHRRHSHTSKHNLYSPQHPQ
jgi:hypothetical protein